MNQGDLGGVLEHYGKALAIKQAKVPGSLVEASTLNNMGWMARSSNTTGPWSSRPRCQAWTRRAPPTTSATCSDVRVT
jgi:hypothetical protein